MTYFHSATEEHSLTIIKRKWQRKLPSSDKHMNLWICEWEPQRANVMLSGTRAVYIVELHCEGLLIYTFCWKLSLDEELLADWMLLHSSSSQPFFECAPPMK